ncbi:MAG: DNA replication/repair protein RecF [Anaerolineales bacterium]|nr:DNA replication/repair protein RecF [Anaerolineales bacterium]
MHLTRLSLTQFRNFARLDVDVPDGTVLVVGDNAQGKTSILEGIYFLATLTSFHADSDRQLVNFLEARNPVAVGRIVADYERAGRKHRLEVRIIQESTRNGVARVRKEVLLDGTKKKLGEIVGHFNAVLFLPQMMGVIEGSPGDRRRYLDLALSQVVPHYAENLSEYNKVLSQRNALLKQLADQGGDVSQLEFWDERLTLRGAEIIHNRIQAIQEIDRHAGIIHHQLTRGSEVLRLDYQPAYDPVPSPANQLSLLDIPIDRSSVSQEKIKTGFMRALEAIRREEIARGVTTIGPHRDELRFLSNGIDLGTYGSRGQVRTTMLTMKLAEVEWMQEQTGHKPVLLLDEVLAELDHARREDLLNRVGSAEQALLTTTDLNLFHSDFVKQTHVWGINQGRLVENDELGIQS